MLKQCIANHPLKGRDGPFIRRPSGSSLSLYAEAFPSGEKEEPAILRLIGRLSSANEDICFFSEGLPA